MQLATRNTHPATRNPHPATRPSQPATRNPQHATRTPHPATRNPHPATRPSQLLLFLAMLVVVTGMAQVPYPVVPDWQSTPLGHVATGLALADINGDGWKDLVVANGNDIARQSLVVYYNNGEGTFPQTPSWSSDDIDYHGHCAAGDLDGDGNIDVVVSVYIGPSGFSSPGKIKVYYNTGNELESTPSFVSDPFYSFSCALGDADGDGDLDIAAAAGEPYSELYDHGKIFLNNGGTFSTTPEWESDNLMGALDVEFGDINGDGFLDVVFACEYSDNYIFLADDAGNIQTSPSWHSSEAENFINSVDIGYTFDPESAMVVMTENDQLGGQGRVRQYDFSDGLPATSSADWYSSPKGYGSGIILYDISDDGHLDLIYGGWWMPIEVFLGDGNGSFQQNVSYTSLTSSVVEAILIADLGKESMLEGTEVFMITAGQHGKNTLVLPEQVVEEVTGITVDGEPLPPAEYSHVPGKPWVIFTGSLQQGSEVAVHYHYSPHGDMVVTNWDGSKGNYIFYNQNIPIGFEELSYNDPKLEAWPNPASGYVIIRPVKGGAIEMYDMRGRQVFPTIVAAGDAFMINVSELKAGYYVVRSKHHSRVKQATILVR